MIYYTKIKNTMDKEKQKRGRPKKEKPPKVPSRKPRTPAKKPPIEIINNCIEENYGIMTTCAKQLGVTPMTMYKWVNSSEKLKETLSNSRDRMIDMAESQLIKNIKDGKETSLIFFLKCQAKKRGYIDRQEVEVNHNVRQIIINVPDEETKQLLNNLKFIDNGTYNIEDDENNL